MDAITKAFRAFFYTCQTLFPSLQSSDDAWIALAILEKKLGETKRAPYWEYYAGLLHVAKCPYVVLNDDYWYYESPNDLDLYVAVPDEACAATIMEAAGLCRRSKKIMPGLRDPDDRWFCRYGVASVDVSGDAGALPHIVLTVARDWDLEPFTDWMYGVERHKLTIAAIIESLLFRLLTDCQVSPIWLRCRERVQNLYHQSCFVQHERFTDLLAPEYRHFHCCLVRDIPDGEWLSLSRTTLRRFRLIRDVGGRDLTEAEEAMLAIQSEHENARLCVRRNRKDSFSDIRTLRNRARDNAWADHVQYCDIFPTSPPPDWVNEEYRSEGWSWRVRSDLGRNRWYELPTTMR